MSAREILRLASPTAINMLVWLRRGPMEQWKTSQTVWLNRHDLVKLDRHGRLCLTAKGRKVAALLK